MDNFLSPPWHLALFFVYSILFMSKWINLFFPPWHLALIFVPSILFMSSWINSLVHPGIVPALRGPDHVLCSFGWCRSFGGINYQLVTLQNISFILGIIISNNNFKLFVVRDPISIDTFNHFSIKGRQQQREQSKRRWEETLSSGWGPLDKPTGEGF